VGAHPFSAPPRYATGATPAVDPAWSKSLLTVPMVFGRDSASWWSRDPAQKLRRLKASGKPLPALFVDAGTEDALYVDQSRAFHWEAERAGVNVVYHEWPGKHDWVYWRAHVGESLRFLAGVIAK
jgi:enterochelin esterase-like enzyme